MPKATRNNITSSLWPGKKGKPDQSEKPISADPSLAVEDKISAVYDEILAKFDQISQLRATARAQPTPNPDAELIAFCQRFAEAELTRGYYEVESGLGNKPDWEGYSHIVDAKAETLEGDAARMLAYSAWKPTAFHDDDDDELQDPSTAMLSAILHSMVGKEWRAIMDRLAAKYGPLSSGHDADGAWIGCPDSTWIDPKITAARAGSIVA